MFKSGIVLNYVKDQKENSINYLTKDLKKYQQKKILVPSLSSNNDIIKNVVNQFPLGTVILRNLTGLSDQVVICYPMFSSHLSLPLKPGEEVWYFTDESRDFLENQTKGTPLLGIKNYWVSRKIGSKISEDLNYTFRQRDTLIDDIIHTADLEEGDVRIPDFSNSDVYREKYQSILPDIETIYSNTKLVQETFPNAVPRFNSKPYDFTLQGSNNSLINLTKNYDSNPNSNNKGAIDIVAGRHALQSYGLNATPEFTFDFSFNNVKNLFEINWDSNFEIDPVHIMDNTISIQNSFGDKELLKDPKYHINMDLIQDEEGEVDHDLDASRIFVSELDNFDSFNYFDISYLYNQKVQKNNSEESVLHNVIKKDYLTLEENSIHFDNFISETININDDLMPSIFMKTNNIRLIARKEISGNAHPNDDAEGGLRSGSIRLIKESHDFNNYSHFLMEKDGDILLDGKTIYIGNFNKELLRKNVIDNESESITREGLSEDVLAKVNESIDSMKGNGSGVIIGYDPEHTEPLVLGETLKAIVTELIQLNIITLEEIKKLSDALKQHVHIGIPGSGVSGIPQDLNPYINYSDTEQPKIIEKLDNIKLNLKDMLSKFAKTS